METSNKGLYARIYHDSGELGTAYDSKDYKIETEKHPDTKSQIKGRIIPQWQEAKQLCLAFHKNNFYDIPCIGWDVCFTKEGPKILEGNLNWSIEIIKSIA